MQNSTKSLPRGQWGNCSYQKMILRPGVGVRIYTVNPAARFESRKVPDQLEGTTRGKVVGFSHASAARLRKVLFMLDFNPATAFGMAFTSAPWVKRRPEDAFKALQMEVKRCKGLRCAVWRKEVTRKGLPHYHAAIWATSPEEAFKVWCWLGSRWVHHLLRDGVCPGVAFLSGSKAFKRKFKGAECWPTNLESWNTLGKFALWGVNCRFDLRKKKDSGNFVDLSRVSGVQYLCDHTSKHKAYQAKTTGRAWGIWNREALPFVDLPGVSLAECPLRLLADLRKALAKMSRYWWPDKDAPFGYRWSRPRRFSFGDKVLFRSQAANTLLRIVEEWKTACASDAAAGEPEADARLGRTPHRPPASAAEA